VKFRAQKQYPDKHYARGESSIVGPHYGTFSTTREADPTILWAEIPTRVGLSSVFLKNNPNNPMSNSISGTGSSSSSSTALVVSDHGTSAGRITLAPSVLNGAHISNNEFSGGRSYFWDDALMEALLSSLTAAAAASDSNIILSNCKADNDNITLLKLISKRKIPYESRSSTPNYNLSWPKWAVSPNRMNMSNNSKEDDSILRRKYDVDCIGGTHKDIRYHSWSSEEFKLVKKDNKHKSLSRKSTLKLERKLLKKQKKKNHQHHATKKSLLKKPAAAAIAKKESSQSNTSKLEEYTKTTTVRVAISKRINGFKFVSSAASPCCGGSRNNNYRWLNCRFDFTFTQTRSLPNERKFPNIQYEQLIKKFFEFEIHIGTVDGVNVFECFMQPKKVEAFKVNKKFSWPEWSFESVNLISWIGEGGNNALESAQVLGYEGEKELMNSLIGRDTRDLEIASSRSGSSTDSEEESFLNGTMQKHLSNDFQWKEMLLPLIEPTDCGKPFSNHEFTLRKFDTEDDLERLRELLPKNSYFNLLILFFGVL